MRKRVRAICQVLYSLIYSFLFPLRCHYWLFILLDCLRFEAPTWLAAASWLLITLTRVKEIDHKEFASSCCDGRNNYLIRKVTVIKWLVLHLLLWSNGVLGKPEQLKVEIWSKHVKVKAEDTSVMRVTGQTVCSAWQLNRINSLTPLPPCFLLFHCFLPFPPRACLLWFSSVSVF